MESKVKKWVNETGYWVYYLVEVKNEKESIKNGQKIIDADFECEANVLDSGADETGVEKNHHI